MSIWLTFGFFTFMVGFLFGMAVAGRHVDRECEMAYLTGHVDGYGKAVADGGEVWE